MPKRRKRTSGVRDPAPTDDFTNEVTRRAPAEQAIGLAPSLSKIPTDLDRLYSELGGPALLPHEVSRREFATYCNEFPFHEIGPVLFKFSNSDVIVKRHWPWVAFALGQYCLERQETKDSLEPSPAEVIGLLTKIAASAKKLTDMLALLWQYGHRQVGVPGAPFRYAHIAYLDQLLSEALASLSDSKVSDEEMHFWRVRSDLLDRLIILEHAAAAAVSQADKGLLKGKRGQIDLALHNFVVRCAEVWESVTPRVASASKVTRRVASAGTGDDPDFVIFIQGLVDLAGGNAPSRKSIEIILKKRKLRPPDDARKI